MRNFVLLAVRISEDATEPGHLPISAPPRLAPLDMGSIARFWPSAQTTLLDENWPSSGRSNSAVTPAKAGAHIPEAGVYGPRISPG